MGLNLDNLRLHNGFLDMTSKVQATKEKISWTSSTTQEELNLANTQWVSVEADLSLVSLTVPATTAGAFPAATDIDI